MITVFYDHQKFSTQKYGGISRYFANLVLDIQKRPDFDYLLGLLSSNNYYLRHEKRAISPSLANAFLNNPLLKAEKINEWYCKRLLEKNNFDIFHPTYYDPYFINRTKKPIVTTIHDMTYERLPEYFWPQDPLTSNKRKSIECADKIIAISETTKADLLAYSDADPAKVEVIYHGIDDHFETAPVPGIPANYLLFVGDRGGYKNFYRFLYAFKNLSARYPEIKVILTGGGGVGISDQEFIHRLRLEDKVIHVNVSDEQLNFLYQHALAFVYPSLHEGFGYPILEAYKAKCAVLLSDTPCFREIAADAAAFFDAYSTEDLTVMLEKMITDTAFKNDLVERGTRRLADFPIQKSIDETLALYRTMV